MLYEPPTSAYDINFELFGYRVRIFWAFWLMALLLGWGWSQDVNDVAGIVGMDSPGAPVLLVIWVLAVFISILVHELGHSLAFSYYGVDSHIVLYHFGGLAIPGSFSSWNAARQRHIGPHEQIVISAAGPIFQLLLALGVWILGFSFGIRMELIGYQLGPGEFPGSAAVYAIFNALLFPSVFWALLNLAPILPLDGGQIMRNVLLLTNVRNPNQAASIASIVTGILLGLFFLQSGQPFAGIMFFMFAASNWQSMQYGSGGF